MKFIRRILLITSMATFSLQFSCAPTSEPSLKIGQAYAIDGKYYYPKIQPGYKEVGYASWYGSRFHRKRTANGEVFDKNEFTAAHKTLPLPSIVKVTNLSNGRSIRVRVNDRGPFVRGRIIDMSENAASALGYKGRGLAKVMVELDRQASLDLLKDPRLRMKEAQKKQVMEAYQRYDMPSSRNSRENLSIKAQNQLQAQMQEQEPAGTAASQIHSQEKIPPVKPRLELQQISQNLEPQQINLQPLQVHPQKQEQIQLGQPTKSQQSLSPQNKQLQPKKINQKQQQKIQQGNQLQEQNQVKQKTQPQQNPQKNLKAPQLVQAPRIPKSQQKNLTYTQPSPPQKPSPDKLSERQQPAVGGFAIQVASTTVRKDAERILAELKNLGGKITQVNVNGLNYFRIYLAGISSYEDAKLKLNTVKSIGFKDAFILKNSK